MKSQPQSLSGKHQRPMGRTKSSKISLSAVPRMPAPPHGIKAHIPGVYEHPINRSFYDIIPTNASVETVVIQKLSITGSCFLDDLITSLPGLSSVEICATVNHMSRDGRVWLRQVSYLTYQVTLSTQLAPPPSSYRQVDWASAPRERLRKNDAR